MRSDKIKDTIIEQMELIEQRGDKPSAIILDHASFYKLLRNPVTAQYYKSIYNGALKHDTFIDLPIAKLETTENTDFIKVY
jgi:hypothetical protein